MENKPVHVETVRRVYVEDEGRFLTVGPWCEVPGFLCLYTEGDKNHDWFGRQEISMTPAFARALARALNNAADDMENS